MPKIDAQDIFIAANARYQLATKRKDGYIDNLQLRCVVEAIAEVLSDFTTPVVMINPPADEDRHVVVTPTEAPVVPSDPTPQS